MRAQDVMSTKVVTVSSDTSISDLANLLLRHRISAVPVVDAEQRILGMVSEGDLLHRAETGTEHRHSWWLSLLATVEDTARDYVKSHGVRASDVMTGDVVTVEEDTSLAEIAQLLEERRIKRVPVTRDGKLVGLVSRADLVRALATRSKGEPVPASPEGDQTIRKALLQTLDSTGLVMTGNVNVIVTEGVVHMWGVVESDDIRNAVRVAAENVPGVRGVESHIGRVPPWAWVG
ncbi:MAG: CBS domain-containing protein [Rhodospirillales bacterium]|nr:CBS domain-containing protein [Rhodospirillales bacterium]MDH3912914.1 CBS domain-containing protein [Rhodospirillales bacterium]MDH3920285.1 CBS domain-containing protein [Rhodospirillales bacterium]MDH3968606.1 CBS domain-containing protein [Rhodospirillales bacterium]